MNSLFRPSSSFMRMAKIADMSDISPEVYKKKEKRKKNTP